MWKVVQFLIFSAVVMSNAIWEWTPNPYVASGVGFALAFVVTVAVTSRADALHGAAHWAESFTQSGPGCCVLGKPYLLR